MQSLESSVRRLEELFVPPTLVHVHGTLLSIGSLNLSLSLIHIIVTSFHCPFTIVSLSPSLSLESLTPFPLVLSAKFFGVSARGVRVKCVVTVDDTEDAASAESGQCTSSSLNALLAIVSSSSHFSPLFRIC